MDSSRRLSKKVRECLQCMDGREEEGHERGESQPGDGDDGMPHQQKRACRRGPSSHSQRSGNGGHSPWWNRPQPSFLGAARASWMGWRKEHLDLREGCGGVVGGVAGGGWGVSGVSEWQRSREPPQLEATLSTVATGIGAPRWPAWLQWGRCTPVRSGCERVFSLAWCVGKGRALTVASIRPPRKMCDHRGKCDAGGYELSLLFPSLAVKHTRLWAARVGLYSSPLLVLGVWLGPLPALCLQHRLSLLPSPPPPISHDIPFPFPLS